MKRRMLAALAFLAFLLSGCAAQQPAIYTPPLECVGEPECKFFWERAQVWVAKNSYWKIQVATDVMISTYNAAPNSPHNSYSLVREPLGDGRERITMRTGCNNMFGCTTRADVARRSLYDYVTKRRETSSSE